MNFPAACAAICGPIDSGKTNVVRAIRSLMRREEAPYYVADDEQISVKDDYPKWKDERAGAQSTSLYHIGQNLAPELHLSGRGEDARGAGLTIR